MLPWPHVKGEDALFQRHAVVPAAVNDEDGLGPAGEGTDKTAR